MDILRCVNCGIAANRLRRHNLEEPVLSIIQQWITPLIVTTTDLVCHDCWLLAMNHLPEATSQVNEHPIASVGHQHVCVNCGRSLLRARSHQLRNNTVRESHIYDVISLWIKPQQVRGSASICHACWQRADRTQLQPAQPAQPAQNAESDSEEPANSGREPLPETIHPTIILLPGFKRACNTQRQCFVMGCRGEERCRVPLSLRAFLLKKYKYYIPIESRTCNLHLGNVAWDFLNERPYNNNHSFSADYIEDMLIMSNTSDTVIDFEHINNMPDHLVKYWLGRTKEQYNTILAEVPRLAQVRRGAMVLAVYLIKIRTGDSYERIGSLMQISARTASNMAAKAREVLTEDYVPRHIGINHINREQIAHRNLLIPNGLFGNEQRTTPIVIMDGTYVYVQKSSNYLYQKNTYSLHKYRNLVKMMIIVSTDGYIIEVLGPYPATSSDADITNNLFSENQPMRNYFQEGDVFVLDRGFRDSLPILHECGYQVHKPESVQEGETQLTTLQANRSRAVTICRWVVEIVNGRFKRDFKIFRQDYYNATSQNIMKDFKIAAALTNAFHPLLNDRNDAGEILSIIQEKMFSHNLLASVVANSNLNRRRANFERINVNNNNLDDFPRLTYSELILVSLGTYQIKQARSYYGEHIRANGTYTIEVCREVSRNLFGELSNPNHWILRGKIKSRHISRKIYYVYILVDSSLQGRNAIIQHYCNCIVEKRTVGCCAHIITLVWYLAWARYQTNITPPAQHLDDILIIFAEDDDVERVS